MTKQTIFLNIPAYEDPLLIQTIESALSNADFPENLFFSIASQYKSYPEPDFKKYGEQVGVIRYEVETRPSANFIRHELIDKFYSGQDYLMLIDSHMIFAEHWDTILINDYIDMQRIYGDKVIISKQVPGIAGKISMFDNISNELTKWNPIEDEFLNDSEFWKTTGNFQRKLNGRPYTEKTTNKFNLTNYASSHFLFVKGSYVSEVGIINAHNQISEEQVNSFLSFINGWDIYSIKDFNHVGHLDKAYNLSVYGAEWLPERSYGVLHDSDEVAAEIDNLLIYNDFSRFAVKNPARQPIEFYRAIGLEEEYLTILSYLGNSSS